MNSNEMLGTKSKQANPTSPAHPQSVDVQNMDLKEQSAGYIVKVTTIKLFNIAKEYKRYFTLASQTLTYTHNEGEIGGKEFDFQDLQEIRIPSTRYPMKPQYDETLVDLVFSHSVLTITGHKEIPGSIDLVKDIIETARVYIKYKVRPSDEEVKQMLGKFLDDAMFEGANRDKVLKLGCDYHWTLIREQEVKAIQRVPLMRKCMHIIRHNGLTLSNSGEIVSIFRSINKAQIQLLIEENGIETLFEVLHDYCIRSQESREMYDHYLALIANLMEMIYALLNSNDGLNAIKSYVTSCVRLLDIFFLDDGPCAKRTADMIIYLYTQGVTEDEIDNWLTLFGKEWDSSKPLQPLVDLLGKTDKEEVALNLMKVFNVFVAAHAELYGRMKLRSLLYSCKISATLDHVVEKAKIQDWTNKQMIDDEFHIFYTSEQKDKNNSTDENGVDISSPHSLFRK